MLLKKNYCAHKSDLLCSYKKQAGKVQILRSYIDGGPQFNLYLKGLIELEWLINKCAIFRFKRTKMGGNTLVLTFS